MMKKKLLQIFIDELAHWVFPSLCISCNEKIERQAIFCSACLHFLELMESEERCLSCFAIKGSCLCVETSCNPVIRGAVFESNAVIEKWISAMQEPLHFFLVYGAAAWMFLQWNRLKWPVPDSIVYLPYSFEEKVLKKHRVSAFLAKNLAKQMKVPCKHLFKKENEEAIEVYDLKRKEKKWCLGKTLLMIEDTLSPIEKVFDMTQQVFNAEGQVLYILSFSA